MLFSVILLLLDWIRVVYINRHLQMDFCISFQIPRCHCHLLWNQYFNGYIVVWLFSLHMLCFFIQLVSFASYAIVNTLNELIMMAIFISHKYTYHAEKKIWISTHFDFNKIQIKHKNTIKIISLTETSLRWWLLR